MIRDAGAVEGSGSIRRHAERKRRSPSSSPAPADTWDTEDLGGAGHLYGAQYNVNNDERKAIWMALRHAQYLGRPDHRRRRGGRQVAGLQGALRSRVGDAFRCSETAGRNGCANGGILYADPAAAVCSMNITATTARCMSFTV